MVRVMMMRALKREKDKIKQSSSAISVDFFPREPKFPQAFLQF